LGLDSWRVDGFEASFCSGRSTDELIELHEQLPARDNAFRAWDERIEALQMSQSLGEAAAEIRELSETTTGMRPARVWRLGERYWKMREWFKPLMRRGG
jgi:hypothetical protein